MRIEHSNPDPVSAKMTQLSPQTFIRFWLTTDRFIDIRACNNDTAVIIESFQAPGGRSYATALSVSPNSFNGIIIK